MAISRNRTRFLLLSAGILSVVSVGILIFWGGTSSLPLQKSSPDSESIEVTDQMERPVSSGSSTTHQKQEVPARPYLHSEYVRVEHEADFSKRFQQACLDQNWALADKLLVAFAYRLNSNPEDLKPDHLRRTLEIVEAYTEKEPNLVRHVPEWTEYRFTYRAMLGELGEAQKAYQDLLKYHPAFVKSSDTCYPFYLTQKDPSVTWETQNLLVRQCLREGKMGTDAVMDLLGPILSRGEYERASRIYSGYLKEFPDQGLVPFEWVFRDVPTEDRN